MKIIVCIDKNKGMAFDKSRKLQDEILTDRILKITSGSKLLMNDYSYQLFDSNLQITPDNKFLENSTNNDFCFVEDVDISPYENKINTIILYRFNRAYPSDLKFNISLEKGWELISREDFEDLSQEKITEEIYERNYDSTNELQHKRDKIIADNTTVPFQITYAPTPKVQKGNQNSDTKQKNDIKKGSWGRFLDSIEKDVDDALIIYKGKHQINAQDQNQQKRYGFGICAQLNHDYNATQIKPLCSEVIEWLEIFESINEGQKLDKLIISCTFTENKSEDKNKNKSEDKSEDKNNNEEEEEEEEGEEEEEDKEDKDKVEEKINTTRDFYIIEYGKNFIRSHLVVEEVMHCLFFSQTQSYIFVGYCSSSSKKVAAPCKTFCAIEKLANFVRDCELYDKMTTKAK